MSSALIHTRHRVALGLLAALILTGCTSRYRMDLYMITEANRKKVNVEKTFYRPNTVLSDPLSERQVVPGEGNTAIVVTGTRGNPVESPLVGLLGFDEYLRIRLYLQFPDTVRSDTMMLAGRSFVQMMGRYQWPPEDKIFQPRSGQLIVDSVTTDHIYAAIDGSFRNRHQLEIEYEGRFKVETHD